MPKSLIGLLSSGLIALWLPCAQARPSEWQTVIVRLTSVQGYLLSSCLKLQGREVPLPPPSPDMVRDLEAGQLMSGFPAYTAGEIAERALYFARDLAIRQGLPAWALRTYLLDGKEPTLAVDESYWARLEEVLLQKDLRFTIVGLRPPMSSPKLKTPDAATLQLMTDVNTSILGFRAMSTNGQIRFSSRTLAPDYLAHANLKAARDLIDRGPQASAGAKELSRLILDLMELTPSAFEKLFVANVSHRKVQEKVQEKFSLRAMRWSDEQMQINENFPDEAFHEAYSKGAVALFSKFRFDSGIQALLPLNSLGWLSVFYQLHAYPAFDWNFLATPELASEYARLLKNYARQQNIDNLSADVLTKISQTPTLPLLRLSAFSILEKSVGLSRAFAMTRITVKGLMELYAEFGEHVIRAPSKTEATLTAYLDLPHTRAVHVESILKICQDLRTRLGLPAIRLNRRYSPLEPTVDPRQQRLEKLLEMVKREKAGLPQDPVRRLDLSQFYNSDTLRAHKSSNDNSCEKLLGEL